MNMLGQRTPSAGRSRPSSATHRVEGNIGFVKSAEVISPDVNKFLGTEACLGSAGAEQSRARNVTRSGSGLSSGKPFTRTGSGFSSGKLPMRNSGTTVANYDGAAVIKCDKVQEMPLHRDSFRLIRSRYPKNNGELDLTRRPKISWLGQFLAKVFGISKSKCYAAGDGSRKRASKLIHPDSAFCSLINILSTLFLAYTAVVTPIVLGFFWYTSPCEATPFQEVEMACDLFFMLEILANFFIAYFTAHGDYVDDFRSVVVDYVRNGLFFDCLTSIPVSWIDFWVLQMCQENDSSYGTVDENSMHSEAQRSLRTVRILKPLKVLKILRVLRSVAVVMRGLINLLDTYLRIPSLLVEVILYLLGSLYAVHCMACFWWLIRAGSTLIPGLNSGEASENFSVQWTCNRGKECGIERYPACPTSDICVERGGLDPKGLLPKYFLAFYFMSLIFTTVGFGDVTPESDWERLYVSLCFYICNVVFSISISKITSALYTLARLEHSVVASTQAMKRVLLQDSDGVSAYNISRPLEKRILHWLECNVLLQCQEQEAVQNIKKLEPALREKVLTCMENGMLKVVPLFRKVVNEHQEAPYFLIQAFALMELQAFPSGCHLAKRGQDPKGLYFVRTGTVRATCIDVCENFDPSPSAWISMNAVESPQKSAFTFWGESSLMVGLKGMDVLTDVLMMPYHVISFSHVDLVVLTAANFQKLLRGFPGLVPIFRNIQYRIAKKTSEDMNAGVAGVQAAVPPSFDHRQFISNMRARQWELLADRLKANAGGWDETVARLLVEQHRKAQSNSEYSLHETMDEEELTHEESTHHLFPIKSRMQIRRSKSNNDLKHKAIEDPVARATRHVNEPCQPDKQVFTKSSKETGKGEKRVLVMRKLQDMMDEVSALQETIQALSQAVAQSHGMHAAQQPHNAYSEYIADEHHCPPVQFFVEEHIEHAPSPASHCEALVEHTPSPVWHVKLHENAGEFLKSASSWFHKNGVASSPPNTENLGTENFAVLRS